MAEKDLFAMRDFSILNFDFLIFITITVNVVVGFVSTSHRRGFLVLASSDERESKSKNDSSI